MPLSDLDSNRPRKPPRASSEKKRRMQRKEENLRSTSISYSKPPELLLGDPNLSSIHYNNQSMSEYDSHIYTPSHPYILSKPNLTLNISTIPSTKSTKNMPAFVFPRQMPSVIYDEDEGIPTTKRPVMAPKSSSKEHAKTKRKEFYEKAVLLGLSQILKMQKSPMK